MDKNYIHQPALRNDPVSFRRASHRAALATLQAWFSSSRKPCSKQPFLF